MAAKFQVTVDCEKPDLLARFWATALGYSLQEHPDGSISWAEYWRKLGVPEDELEDGYDSIIDPDGRSPKIWFQHRKEPKRGINRLHFDLCVGGGRQMPIGKRMEAVDAEATRLERAGASIYEKIHSPEVDHYFAAMRDPEGNEFDIV